MKPALLLASLSAPFLLASCAMFGGLSSDEEQRLTEYSRRARRYFDDASRTNQPNYYQRALDQCGKGRELDPENYMLTQTEGWCYLKLARWDVNYLPLAEEKFQEVMPMRDVDTHDPRTLLGYGLTLHQLAVVQKQMATTAESEAKRAQEATAGGRDPASRAKEHRDKAKSYLANAERQLKSLLQNEDFTLLAHQHLMNLKELEGDYGAAKEHGVLALVELDKERADWTGKYERTRYAGYEREAQKALNELTSYEKRIRTSLSFLYFRDKQYELALEQLDKMIEMQPNDPLNYYNRGSCYRALGRVTDAKKDFKKFLGTTSLSESHTKVTDAFRYTYGKK